ncbi:macrophage receptor MARCO [Macrotis lagotis]|uniref:macrophage receptor MARCO n=1 Tax=Macrotis lagotis TaxID=92651 RepID=UPI003D68E0BA
METQESFKKEEVICHTNRLAAVEPAMFSSVETFEISESKPKKKCGGNFITSVIIIYLVLFTAGVGFLVIQVLSLQKEMAFQKSWLLTLEQLLFPNGTLESSLDESDPSFSYILSSQSSLNIKSERKWFLEIEKEITEVQVSQEELRGRMDNITMNSGFRGSKGDPGSPGRQGEKGDSGSPGKKGEKGIAGRDGMPGQQGVRGPPGYPGAAGIQGPKGIPGEQGPAGVAGTQGEKGSKGDSGLIGPKGEAGVKGDKGDQGLTGSKGEMGQKGDMGMIGQPGSPGLQGIAGEPGKAGMKGSPGPKGEPGQPGAKGIAGIPGLPGLSATKGEPGQSGPVGPQGHPGRDGSKGEPGAKGNKGDSGPPGEKGIQGSVGNKGEPGLKGSKGEKGEQGQRGPQGSKGEPGRSSDVRIVGGESRGRAEIFYQGVWGTICDDDWDDQDATVFCRMMGYRSGSALTNVAVGSGQIWLDNVACTGTENSLWSCQKNAWGDHNCKHSEDAGVICR